MASNVVLIAAADAEMAAQAAGPELEDKLRAAMQATASHWLTTNEDEQFLAACEGVARCCKAADRERIVVSLRLLQSLSAAVSGVPVDFARLVAKDEDERVEPAPLKRIWDEVKGR